MINVVDLMTLPPPHEHPHGLSERDFDDLFTRDKPIIFAYHGYPWLIHRLTYARHNHAHLHVRGTSTWEMRRCWRCTSSATASMVLIPGISWYLKLPRAEISWSALALARE